MNTATVDTIKTTDAEDTNANRKCAKDRERNATQHNPKRGKPKHDTQRRTAKQANIEGSKEKARASTHRNPSQEKGEKPTHAHNTI